MATYTVERKGNLYIARHGRTHSNSEGRFGLESDELNEQGWEDAEKLRQQLMGVPLTKIASSEFPRAKQTTEPIRNERGLELLVIPELREVDFGILKGKHYHQGCSDAYDAVAFALLHERESGGESTECAYARAIRVREIITQDYSNDDTLFVTHGTFAIFLGLALDGVDWRCSDATKRTGIFDRSRGLKNGQWWHYKINKDGSIAKIKET